MLKELVKGLVYRSVTSATLEKRIASGYLDKYDLGSMVKWGVTCNSCPYTSRGQWSPCLSGFTLDNVPYETTRCKDLVNMSDAMPSRENLQLFISCKGTGR